MAGAFQARKRPVQVRVEFADRAGTLETREGPVHYGAGDALLTGVDGERWPIPQARFVATYCPCAPTTPGEAGCYRKRPLTVWAWRTPGRLEVELSEGRGQLHAEPDDVLVQYGPGDIAVVSAAIFRQTYEAFPTAVFSGPADTRLPPAADAFSLDPD